MLSAIIFAFLVTCLLFYFRSRLESILPFRLVILAWIIQLLACGMFYWVYTYYYGNGTLSFDAQAYLEESRKMNEILFTDPSAYFEILISGPNCEQEIAQYFGEYRNSRMSRSADPLGETRNHIRMLSIIRLFSFNTSGGMQIILLLLHFLGLLFVFSAIQKIQNLPTWSFVLFLSPSLVFWSCSPLKEVLSILGLCLVLGVAIQITYSRRNWTYLIIGLILILLTKSYLFICLAISCIFILLVYWTKHKKVFALILTIGIVGSSIYWKIPEKVIRTIEIKQLDFKNIARGGIHLKNKNSYYHLPLSDKKNLVFLDNNKTLVSIKQDIEVGLIPFRVKRITDTVGIGPEDGVFEIAWMEEPSGSRITLPEIKGSWIQLIKLVPLCLFNTFLQPTPFQSSGLGISSFFFLENLFFLFMLLITAKRIIQSKDEMRNIYWVFFLSTILLAWLIGLTTPVVGAIVRYKIPIYLILITLYLLTRKNKKLLHE